MIWAYKLLGTKGTIVKIKIATYCPLFLVGASSEVTDKAVNSAMPAPAPTMVIPAKRCQHLIHRIVAHAGFTNEDVHCFSCGGHDCTNHKQRGAEHSDISTSEQICKRSHERAHTGKSK